MPRRLPSCSARTSKTEGAHFVLSIREIAWEASLTIYLVVKGFRAAPILREYTGVVEGSVSPARRLLLCNCKGTEIARIQVGDHPERMRMGKVRAGLLDKENPTAAASTQAGRASDRSGILLFMAPVPVTWEREDHTEAKHDLLLAFFNKWVSIHSESFAKRGGGLVRIYDGFAGPGVYSGGEPGSPLILIRALCTNPNLNLRWREVRYELHFVEKDPGRARMLEQQLQDFEREMRDGGGWTDRVEWSVTCGRYEDNVPQPVRGNSALFLFLDPFGYSHAPMTLTQDLIQQPKSDTLIFLPLSFVHRFADREGQDKALDRLFGTPAWRHVPDGAGRPDALLELFQEQLRGGGLDWVLPFRLKPDDGRNAYWIVGGSAHPAGFASIKEGFWAADPVNGQGFAAPRSPPPGQEVFDFVEAEPQRPNTRPLLEQLRERFGRHPFTVEDAIELTKRSRFLERHLKRQTLAPAEEAETLHVHRPAGARQFKEGKGITMRFV